MLRAVLVTLRPHQWSKNVLVAAAPLAAGEITDLHVLRGTLIAFVAFCLAASAVYCVNDVIDADADRAHPTKCRRPVARGDLPARTALATGAVLGLGSLALCAAAPGTYLWAVVLAYLAVSLSYSLGLKHEAVLEFALVSSGFLLRAVAGGPATGLPLSRWFLIVAGFGSLMMVCGKRLAELIDLQGRPAGSRRILDEYSTSFLRMVIAIAAGVTTTAYCLWAFEVGDRHHGFPWSTISVAPFVVAILRYLLDVDAGRAEEPERIVLRDRTLQGLGVAWLVVFSLGALRG